MRATRAYIAGFGTAGSILAGCAVLFVLASAVVAFRGWPKVASPGAPASLQLSATPSPGSRVDRRLRVAAAAASAFGTPGLRPRATRGGGGGTTAKRTGAPSSRGPGLTAPARPGSGGGQSGAGTTPANPGRGSGSASGNGSGSGAGSGSGSGSGGGITVSVPTNPPVTVTVPAPTVTIPLPTPPVAKVLGGVPRAAGGG